MYQPLIVYWVIYWGVLTFSGIGLLYILRKNYLRYGIITGISLLLSITLCVFFYLNEFYRFIFPLPYILPVVSVSFTYLVLFSIYNKPKQHTFPFYFMMINLVFGIELILRYYFHYIVYKEPWDTWDSYTLYWVYLRLFAFFGDWLVPLKFRKPIQTDSKVYWISLIVVLVGSISGFLFVLNHWNQDHL